MSVSEDGAWLGIAVSVLVREIEELQEVTSAMLRQEVYGLDAAGSRTRLAAGAKANRPEQRSANKIELF
jgi:hypothetical protein